MSAKGNQPPANNSNSSILKKEKRMAIISDDDVSKIFQKRQLKMMRESLSSKLVNKMPVKVYLLKALCYLKIDNVNKLE